MRKLILATVSALALGIAGAGIGQAAEPAANPEPAPQGAQALPGAARMQGAQSENWSKSQIKGVQQQLKTAGAYDGPINGKLDAQTQQAVEKFQGEHGLKKTGTLDQQTLAALGNPSKSGATAPGNQGR